MREVRDRRSRARGEKAPGTGVGRGCETDGVVSRVVEAVEGVMSSLFYDT